MQSLIDTMSTLWPFSRQKAEREHAGHSQAARQGNLQRLRRYTGPTIQQVGASKFLTELKLVLVGDTGVGKSCLVSRVRLPFTSSISPHANQPFSSSRRLWWTNMTRRSKTTRAGNTTSMARWSYLTFWTQWDERSSSPCENSTCAPVRVSC
jgi:hypothetical protein